MYNLNGLLEKALYYCTLENIPFRKITHITVNNRLSKAWGRCLSKSGSGRYWIEVRGIIADDKITPEKSAMEIILHEVIHTCEGCWNHGALFKEYSKRLEKYGYYNVGGASTTIAAMNIDNEVYTEKCKYEVRCTKCGYAIGKNRMCNLIKYASSHTHNRCNAPFERVR